jgi:hypothetical protein
MIGKCISERLLLYICDIIDKMASSMYVHEHQLFTINLIIT